MYQFDIAMLCLCLVWYLGSPLFSFVLLFVFTMETNLVLNSPSSTCLCLPGARFKDKCHPYPARSFLVLVLVLASDL